jgi:UDP-N-acetylglucosamine/UDP-N-acetyl-alpha-D-glucosaminouronate 4-epimerase
LTALIERMITSEIKNFIQESICVVTGGAGFIGSNLVDELLRLKAKKVVVMDDLSTGFSSNIEAFHGLDNFAFIEKSIDDFEACLEVFQDADIIFQMAALGSVPRSIDAPINTNSVNVDGFLNVLTAAKDLGINKVVYSSSSSVYGDDEHLPKVEEHTGNPLSPYAVTKKANELYARVFHDVYGMDIIGLRYFNVFGPKQSEKGPYAAVIPIFINNLLNNKTCKINGDGTISRDFTYVQNVVEANICAAYATVNNLEDRVLNIAMGEQLSLNELYSILEGEINSGMEVVHENPRVGDIQSSQADISKAKRAIGYKPSHPMKEGLIKTIVWNRED